MSHFTVLVVGPDPEEQLAPFQENNMGDCPRELLEFNDTEDEMLDEYENKSTTKIKSPDGKLFWRWDDQFNDPNKPYSKDKNYPEGYEEVEVPFKEIYATFEEFAEDYHGCEGRDEYKRRYGYWENPNSKWDWYVLGGRWMGNFKLKEGGWGEQGEPGVGGNTAPEDWVDQAYKSDIDWDAVKEKSIKNAEETWKEYEADTKQTPEQKEFWYGIKKGETREQYLARRANFSVFAVIKDGKWYEKGEMGWWGCVRDEKDPDTWSKMVQELLNEVPDDTLLSVFDCHI